MKKIILIIIVAFYGCDFETEEVKRNIERNKNAESVFSTFTPLYKIVVIDSCEYLVTQYYNAEASLTHKGNCNNEFHKTK